MNESEYDRWRQHLEEDLEAAFDLVRAGVKAQLRVLDRLRLEAAERGASRSTIPEPHSAPRSRVEGGAPPTASSQRPDSGAVQPAPAAPPVIPQPGAPPERKRRPAGELLNLVLAALQELPEVFDSRMLQAKLQPPPKKATLYQTLQNLMNAGWIERLPPGLGGKSSHYRGTGQPDLGTGQSDRGTRRSHLRSGLRDGPSGDRSRSTRVWSLRTGQPNRSTSDQFRCTRLCSLGTGVRYRGPVVRYRGLAVRYADSGVR